VNALETAPTTPSRRVPSIDVARALALTGVVFGHAVDGLQNSGIVGMGDGLTTVHNALYILRMPAMALIVGLFIPGSVAKRGSARYLADRVVLMLYLYVVWFFVQGVVEVATSSIKNKPRGPETLLTVWVTYGHLWFLPFLAVATVAVVLARPWGSRSRNGLLLVFLAGGVLLWGWNAQIVGLRGLALVFFVAVGSVVGLRRLGGLMQARPAVWGLVGTAAVAVYLLLLGLGPVAATDVNDTLPSIATRAVSITTATFGIVTLLAVSVGLARLPVVGEFLAKVGRVTLPIYLAHLIVVAGIREVLEIAGVRSPVPYLVLGVLLGMVAPYLVSVHASRLRLSWLFELPPAIERRLHHRLPARPVAPVPAPVG
jgi:fucose 4-O-acetylase-like acetyltransferase